MDGSTILVLVVDDYEAWRHYVCSTLEEHVEAVVYEGSDGLEAVQKANTLQPDLILLDIGLPALNGIDAARRILALSPKANILFLTENRSPGIVEAALGYRREGLRAQIRRRQ